MPAQLRAYLLFADLLRAAGLLPAVTMVQEIHLMLRTHHAVCLRPN